ncbi:Zinc-type alcohol dehydrogenase-like protein [Neolecta irregularis DAH-3]|uniref:Zinc-type alcohol dehydrogenase-like protein n=1 Tax=Neolecta irregularis (strain DAH-3) TaxID=1198029 RepID=A0A1U7LRD3_NEOID|nr:Zinc-type alcohol dehydrogenase-like protein [Neolecta irregularis DAH-3]|eukprot:OLL25188.1 Zinc-type alcohol dehydrogenase-like protein [Neolecta irregularis DAH-3]
MTTLQKMRAYTYTTHGSPASVLHLATDHPAPSSPTATQILVKVAYASLNPVDYKLLTSSLARPIVKKPCIPASDFSGVVVEAGAESGFKTNDHVYGKQSAAKFIRGSSGSLAGIFPCKYLLVESVQVVLKPNTTSFVDAASFSLAGLTALQTWKAGKLAEGARVLIVGASGGVGTFAVQIAKAKKAYVVAVCSGANAALVKSLGADEVIDYAKHPRLVEYLVSLNKPFDLVFDVVGKDDSLYYQSHRFLAPEKPFLFIATDIGVSSLASEAMKRVLPGFLGGGKRPYILVYLQETPLDFKEFDQLVRDKKVKAVIDSVWEFEDAVGAFEKLMKGHAKGKIIVKVAGDL